MTDTTSHVHETWEAELFIVTHADHDMGKEMQIKREKKLYQYDFSEIVISISPLGDTASSSAQPTKPLVLRKFEPIVSLLPLELVILSQRPRL